MKRFLIACAVLAWTAGAAASETTSPPLRATSGSSCAKKRTDACGCHHFYGLRHCHPKLKTPRCEAPAKGELPESTPQKAHVSL